MDDENEITKLAAQALVDKIEQARDLIDSLVQHHDNLQASDHLNDIVEAIGDLGNSIAAFEQAQSAADDTVVQPFAPLEVQVTDKDGTVTTHRIGGAANEENDK